MSGSTSARSRWFGRRGGRGRSAPQAAPAPVVGGPGGEAPASEEALLIEEYGTVTLLRSPSDDSLSTSDVDDLVRVLAQDAGHTATVVAGAAAAAAGDLWARLADVLDALRADGIGTVRLVLSAAGDDRPGDPALARRVAEDWEIEVIAPDGLALVVPGGGLFVAERYSGAGGELGGWWRFSPGAEPVRIGSRQPAPAWQSAVEELRVAADGGCVIEQVPSGLLARPPGAVPPRAGDLCYAVPADPRGPALVLGVPQGEDLSTADVLGVLSGLPEAVRCRVRLVPGGSRDILRTGQAVADALGTEMVVYTGMPVLSYDSPTGAGRIRCVLVGADGEPRWWPYVDAVVCAPAPADGSAPAPSPRVLRWNPPTGGPEAGHDGVLRLPGGWQATVTRAGMWVTRTDSGPPSATVRPVDAEGPTLEIGHPGQRLDPTLYPALAELFGRLGESVRARAKLYVHGTCPGGGRELRRTAAAHGLRTIRFAGAPLPAPGTAPAPGTVPDTSAALPGPPRQLPSPPAPARPPAASSAGPLARGGPHGRPAGPTVSGVPGARNHETPAQRPPAARAASATAGTPALAPSPAPVRSPARPSPLVRAGLKAPDSAAGPGAAGVVAAASSGGAGPVAPAAPVAPPARKAPASAVPAPETTPGAVTEEEEGERSRIPGAPDEPVKGGPPERARVPDAPSPEPEPATEQKPSQEPEPEPLPGPASRLMTTSSGSSGAFAPSASAGEPRPEPTGRPAAPAASSPTAVPTPPTAPPSPAAPRPEHVTRAPKAARPPTAPPPPVPFPPGHISTDAQRSEFRRLAEAVWERHSGAVARALTRMPVLRGPEQESVRADLVALHVYLHTVEGPLSHGELVRDLDADVSRLLPYVACVASALRRLPSYRGVVFRGAGDGGTAAGPGPAVEPGALLRDPAPVCALPLGPGEPRPAGEQYVIWSSTGRRVRQLAGGTGAGRGREEIVFSPGTLLRVLAVRGTADAPLVLLREVPDGSAPASVAGAGPSQLTELDDHDRAALDRLDEALRRHPVAPGPFRWPDLCEGSLGQGARTARSAPPATR